jgi:hypothetical protein
VQFPFEHIPLPIVCGENQDADFVNIDSGIRDDEYFAFNGVHLGRRAYVCDHV